MSNYERQCKQHPGHVLQIRYGQAGRQVVCAECEREDKAKAKPIRRKPRENAWPPKAR
jgi:hypothetical protein